MRESRDLTCVPETLPLDQQIDKHRCDIKHVTERKGSPQTLVCTKTQDSYERRRKQYGVDQERLAELEGIAENQL